MIDKPIYFDLNELVCEDVFHTFGEQAWSFLDPRLLRTIDNIRQRIGKPIFINSWDSGGDQRESGLRCIKCLIVQQKITAGQLYMSAHMEGQAVDFSVQGLLAEEVRQWIVKNQTILPYPIRLENGVNWVHLDVRDNSIGNKITFFNP
jgi:hypothetical protein